MAHRAPDLLTEARKQARAGQFDRADLSCRNFLRLQPRSVEALRLRASIAQRRGDKELAHKCLRRALAINPKDARLYSAIAMLLQKESKPDQAAEILRRGLSLIPSDNRLQAQLGSVLTKSRKWREAAACFEKCVAQDPKNFVALNNWGYTLEKLNQDDEALSLFERAIALKPDYIDARTNIGQILQKRGNDAEAIREYNAVLALKPDLPGPLNNLANILQTEGKLAEAETLYRRAISAAPEFIEAYYNLSRIFKFTTVAPELEALQGFAKKVDKYSDEDQVFIHFALSKALSDIGQDAQSFEHLLKGNAKKRRWLDYDGKLHRAFMAQMCRLYDDKLIAKYHGAGDPKKTPIFVLGMPRSGSTLIEQILSSHPLVYGAGEIRNFVQAADDVLSKRATSLGDPEIFGKIDSDTLREIGRSYLESLPQPTNGEIRITDKMPGNFLHVGLIYLTLPNAKIIHTMRDPVDTCVSSFSKFFSFSNQPFTYDLEELGRYYRWYRELMRHWHRVLPPKTILDVVYEDVVENLEGQARRLVEFCELEWDERCLNFHENTRKIKTASVTQVRQPIYRNSLKQGQRYQAYLQPLLRELSLPTTPQALRTVAQDALQAEKLYAAAKYDEASKLCTTILAKDPQHAPSLHMCGAVARQKGQLDDAADFVERAIKSAPQVATYYNTLGVILRAQGRAADAETQFRRSLAIDLNQGAVRANLGNALMDLKQHEAAIVEYRTALSLQPDIARTSLALGNALRALGRLDEAVEQYRRALQLDSGQLSAAMVLGRILQRQGRSSEAEAVLEAAVVNHPRSAHAHNLLGDLRLQSGRAKEAVASCQTAVAIEPNFAEAYYNLARSFQALERYDEAVAQYRRALQINPKIAFAHNNLGTILHSSKKYEEAVREFEAAIALDPNFVDAFKNLGITLSVLGFDRPATLNFERAVALKPSSAELRNRLGIALHTEHRFVEAEVQHQAAIALEPQLSHSYECMGVISRTRGDMAAAATYFRRAIELKPDNAEAHLGLSLIKTYTKEDTDLSLLHRLAANSGSMSVADRASIHFALAKALNDTGEASRAFQEMVRGNAEMRSKISYGEDWRLAYFTKIQKAYTPQLLERFRNSGDPSDKPIFILGMPRSGSTLLEQILSSHPRVHGAGELKTLVEVAEDILRPKGAIFSAPDAISDADANILREMGRAYLNRLPNLSESQTKITDKMPGNFFHVGLIHLILPNAKIIHTMRDPIDTCVSCFSTRFGAGHEYCYDLAELGRYYRHYSQLMNHWRKLLPAGSMLDVSYEDVVNDLEGQAKRLVDFCGLEWDARCLNFHKNDRPVATASTMQVRLPIYRDSLERHKRYEAFLQPLLAELGQEESGMTPEQENRVPEFTS